MLLLMLAQEEDWDEIDLAVRQFQAMTQAIKFSPKPVVIAPFGMALGGGMRDVTACGGAAAACGTLHGTGGEWELACCRAEADARKCCCAQWTARQRCGRADAANR